jgi:Fe-S oxidoreductase
MFLRKQKNIDTTITAGPEGKRKILTNCPSCIQGLGRQPKLVPVHLAEELALLLGGENWPKAFKEMVKSCEVIPF